MASACDTETLAPGVFARPPVLRASHVSLARTDGALLVLEDVQLELRAGECVLLQGDTGSGKSTLLRALAGLPGVECRAGRLECAARATLLMQHVETQLLCTTVGEEIALGLRSDPSARRGIAERVRGALGRVGLVGFEAHEVDRLSAGQKQRVVIAALLALDPAVLLLDEPSSALDPPARRALAHVLGELKGQGTALLVADHAPAELEAVVDRRVVLASGRLQPGASPPGFQERLQERFEGRPQVRPRARASGAGRSLITGPNGSGKSTRLRALAARARRPGDVALVIQEPRRALFARTVREEVAFGLVRGGVTSDDRAARVHELLARFDLEGCADRSPRRLSFGQQHRLAIAAALAPAPALVLLDEPFAGLDPSGRDALLALLEEEQARSGAEIFVASHDREPLASWCDHVVELASDGAPMPELAPLPRRPFQFRSGDSVVHRLGAGWKLLLTTAVGALALALEALPALVALLGLVAAGYAWARLSGADLWRDLRWLLLQAAIVVALTVGVRGGDAWAAGCRTALQLVLVFLPVALMLRTTSSQRLLECVQRWMPERLAFAFGATLRFVPVFAREGGELVEMQRLRGARLAARDLWRPGAWRDWLACVALPMTVRAIEVAEEAADAATLRGIGIGIGRGIEPDAGDAAETTRKETA